MRWLSAYALAILALIIVGCNNEEKLVEMSFSPSSETLKCPVEKQLTLRINGKVYDLEENKYGVTFSSSNESVAMVSEKGAIKTLGLGYATITATCDQSSAKYMLLVDGTDYNLDIDYTKKLTGDMIYANNLVISNNTGMQSFDVLKNGDLIIGGSKDGTLYFQRVTPGKTSNSVMSIKYAGHGTNFSVEEVNGEAYIWFSNFGSISGSDCINEQMISRVKYKAGTSIKAEDCTDNYFVSTAKNVMASVDAENDLLSIISGGYIYVYSISAAKNAPEKEFNLAPMARNEGSVSLKVKGHDLTSTTTVASFRIPQNTPIQGVDRDGDTRPMQGFCVYNDKIYYLSGDGTNPDAAVSVLSFDGKVEKSCKQLSLDDNPDDYIPLGVSQTGYLEPEGIKIRYGKMYIGFAWNVKGAKPWTWKATVVRLN